MLTHLTALDAALPAWRASATEPGAVIAALEGVNAALALHLDDEVENIVPVMETTMTQAEVDWFGEHGRKATPKGKTWASLGMILDSQPDGGEHVLRTQMPPPVDVPAGAREGVNSAVLRPPHPQCEQDDADDRDDHAHVEPGAVPGHETPGEEVQALPGTDSANKEADQPQGDSVGPTTSCLRTSEALKPMGSGGLSLCGVRDAPRNGS